MEENKENQKELDQAKEDVSKLVRLAFIGEHFLQFIIACRRVKKDPLSYSEAIKNTLLNPDCKLENKEIPPVVNFIDWLADSNEEKFKKLEKSLGIKIDSVLEDISKKSKND